MGCFSIAASGHADAAVSWNALVGPQAAWSWGRTSGPAWGWEGGAGLGAERLNIGQVFSEAERLSSYVVLEPYTLYVGGTLGLGYGRDGVAPVFGVWEGAPLVYPNNCDASRRNTFEFMLTVAAGYRYFNGQHQIYLTPKAGASQSVSSC